MADNETESHSRSRQLLLFENVQRRMGELIAVLDDVGDREEADRVRAALTELELGGVCAICFAPPGVMCNAAPGWCGSIAADPHERAVLVNPCILCRGTGLWHRVPGFEKCSRCGGTRIEPALPDSSTAQEGSC